MLSYAAKTDLGNDRENNEDCYLACPELCLWVLADGVGGQDGGEIASKIACDVVKTQVEKGCGLAEAINIAHQTIKESCEQGIGKQGMATTIVVLLVHGGEFQIAWVGDSRAYLWSDNHLTQLSHDQSLVQRLVDEKIISKEEAINHPRRNLVIQALGQESVANVEVESIVGTFKNNDKIILCSDGLSDYVVDEQIADLLIKTENDQSVVSSLVSAALQAQGKDNITVLSVTMMVTELNETSQLDQNQVEHEMRKNQFMQKWWWLLLCLIAAVIFGIWVA